MPEPSEVEKARHALSEALSNYERAVKDELDANARGVNSSGVRSALIGLRDGIRKARNALVIYS